MDDDVLVNFREILGGDVRVFRLVRAVVRGLETSGLTLGAAPALCFLHAVERAIDGGRVPIESVQAGRANFHRLEGGLALSRLAVQVRIVMRSSF